MPVLSWAPWWPLAAASRREITEAALTSLSAHATTVPSPSPPPSPDPFPPGPGCLPPHPPTHRGPALGASLHRSVRWWLHRAVWLPATLYQPFLRSLIPLWKPHHQKSTPPSPHCRLFHLLRFLSLPSLCLILVCASACHIKGEPGVREPQAWNINAANCMAVWEINPLKIAPYTSWTHHHSLIRIAPYRNSPRLLWAITQVSKFKNIREVFRNVFLKCDKSGVIWDGCCFAGRKRGPTHLSSSQCICARGRRRIGKTKCQRKALLSKCENDL